MRSCKEITELVSNRLENNKITWYQKIEVALHLMICKRCHHYAQQLRFLQTAFQLATEKATNIFLSKEARERIARKLKKASL